MGGEDAVLVRLTAWPFSGPGLPIAVKAQRRVVLQMRLRHRTGREVGGIEDGQEGVAA